MAAVVERGRRCGPRTGRRSLCRTALDPATRNGRSPAPLPLMLARFHLEHALTAAVGMEAIHRQREAPVPACSSASTAWGTVVQAAADACRRFVDCLRSLDFGMIGTVPTDCPVPPFRNSITAAPYAAAAGIERVTGETDVRVRLASMERLLPGEHRRCRSSIHMLHQLAQSWAARSWRSTANGDLHIRRPFTPRRRWAFAVASGPGPGPVAAAGKSALRPFVAPSIEALVQGGARLLRRPHSADDLVIPAPADRPPTTPELVKGVLSWAVLWNTPAFTLHIRPARRVTPTNSSRPCFKAFARALRLAVEDSTPARAAKVAQTARVLEQAGADPHVMRFVRDDGDQVVFPAARPMTVRPQPPRTHQPSHRGSAVGDYDATIGGVPSANVATSSPGVALTPSSGTIPAELGGTPTAMVPAALERGRSAGVHHPFDGDGMSRPCALNPGAASLSNRFVRTRLGAEGSADQVLYRGVFGTQKTRLARRAQNAFDLRLKKHRQNTHVVRLGGPSCCALWESELTARLDPDTLEKPEAST